MGLLGKIRNKVLGNPGPLRFYSKLVQPGSLCFDIGANEGKKTTLLLSIPARVIAIEPHPVLAEGLRKKFGDSIKVEAVGVSDKSGTELFYPANMSEVSTFSLEFIEAFSGQKFLKWDEGIKVKVKTLEELMERHGTPWFLKIDTEGYEARVLSGLARPVALIEFEYTQPFVAESLRCVDIINGLGRYEFQFSEYESFRFFYDTWKTADEMKAALEELGGTVKHGNVFARRITKMP